jgi:two-component system OmpR family response regulator
MGGYRVLIVEDHTPTRLALKRVFAREGWDIQTAETVAEGLAALDPPPDCVVLDLILPDGDGESILRKIRADGLPTRVVAVTTGVSDPNRLAEVARLRPDVLLTKPIDPEILCRLCRAEVGD